MALLGAAALAMWWDIAPEVRADFEDWHAHEHFPERMGIPGFRRGTRWSDAAGGEGMFVMYEMDDHDVLSSPAYAARLNAPSPWSTRLMPHHRGMVRSQCEVLASRGFVVARHALTVRLSPATAGDASLRAHLAALVDALASRPGLVGAHLLRHRAPNLATTTEQKIRPGADGVADWIAVVTGYDLASLERVQAQELSAEALEQHGASGPPTCGLYAVACSATSGEVR